MITLNFVYWMQFIATTTGIVVAIGAMVHPDSRGWRLKAAFLLLFMAFMPVDIALRVFVTEISPMLRHRLLFLLLSMGALILTLRAYRLERRENGFDAGAWLVMTLIHLLYLGINVMPVWWFEEQLATQVYWTGPSVQVTMFLSVLSYLFLYWIMPLKRNLLLSAATRINRAAFELAILLVIGAVFALLMQATDILVLGLPQMEQITMLSLAFLILLRSVYLVGMEFLVLQRRAVSVPPSTVVLRQPLQSNRPLRLVYTKPAKPSVEDLPRI